MGSIKQTVAEVVGEMLGNLLDTVVEWIVRIFLGPLLEACLKAGTTVYNNMLNNALTIMTKRPDQWNYSGWNFIVSEVNTIFVIFGSTLVVIFFLIGFCAESVDIRHEIRLESILTSFIKLSIAEFFVMNSLGIVTSLFGLVAELTKFRKNLQFSITVDVTTADLAGMSAGAAILGVILAFICMIALIASGAIITYTAYMRFFKILLLIPYGAIASSTIAGNHMLNHTAVSFWKYAVGTVLEGVTMILALVLFARIDGGGGLDFVGKLMGHGNDLVMIGKLIDKTLLALLCLGVVKGSGALTQKVLGL